MRVNAIVDASTTAQASFDRFTDLATRLLKIPKAEIDAEEAKYKAAIEKLKRKTQSTK